MGIFAEVSVFGLHGMLLNFVFMQKSDFLDFEVDRKWSKQCDWRKLQSIFFNVRFGCKTLI